MTESTQNQPSNHRRKPWLAVLLSWPCPGLGHLYAGDLWGVLFSLLAVYFALTGFLVFALGRPAPYTIWLVWLGPILIIALVPLYAWLSARRAPRPYQLKPYNRWYVYLGVWAAWSAVFDLAIEQIRTDVIEAFRVPSGSMEPSVLVGDFMYVDKRPTALKSVTHGAIIIFYSVEEEGMKVMKRVVALPGDTVAMVAGRLMRNGQTISEGYVKEPDGRSEEPMQRAKMRQWQSAYVVVDSGAEYLPDLSDWGPLLVPPDSYFVLGDNRDHSYDGRYWGFVPVENVLGRARVIYWSYDHTSFKPLPFLFAVRWDRIGRDLSH